MRGAAICGDFMLLWDAVFVKSRRKTPKLTYVNIGSVLGSGATEATKRMIYIQRVRLR